ncbi:hypothetical protein ACTFIZ_003517 [Dictyostelium cf. discoideum]
MKYILKNDNEKRNILEKIKKKGGFKQLERFENEIKLGQSIFLTDDFNEPNIILSFSINDGIFKVYVNNNLNPIKVFLESFNWSHGFFKNTIFDENLKNNCNLNKNGNSISYHFKDSIDVIYFCEVDVRVKFLLEDIIKSNGFKIIEMDPNYAGYGEYTLCNIDGCNNEKVINEFKLRTDGNEVPLSINEGYYICGLWEYQTKFSIDEIIWSIKNGLSWCYKLKDGTLVSWVIGFSDGRITQLNTLEEFRGKGYAKKVLSKLIITYLEKGIKPLAYISGENYNSQSLFGKLGYNKSVEVFGLYATK